MNAATVEPLRNAPALSIEPVPGFALVPRSMTEAIDLAKLMATSRLLPKHFNGSPADALLVIEQSIRWRMSPFAVAQATHIVNGRLGYEAKLIAAACYHLDALERRLEIAWDGDGNNRRCTVTGRFRGDPNPRVKVSPTIGSIPVKNSPLWKSDPDQQLAYFTIRAWARLYAPDVILGVYDPSDIAEGGHVGPERARDVTPTGSKLDALEAVIGANTWNADTGEIVETVATTDDATDQPVATAPDDLADWTFQAIEFINEAQTMAVIADNWHGPWAGTLKALKAQRPELYERVIKAKDARKATLGSAA
jgi:hypothetical protein